MKYLIKNKYWNITEDYNIDRLLYLLIDRPNYIDDYGFNWENNKNQYHRDYDLPTYTMNYKLYWVNNNLLHRNNNKPAIIAGNDEKEYYVNGEKQ